MRNITDFVKNSFGFEFIWGELQSSVVVFRYGDFVKLIPLQENSLKEAIKISENFLQNGRRNGSLVV